MAKRATKKLDERNRLRPFSVRPAYLVLFVLMALFTYKFVEKAQEIHGLQAERAALQYENQQTKLDNAHLKQEIRRYGSPAYVGEQARAVLGYTKPGEVAIQVQARKPRVAKVQAAPPTPALQREAIWHQWWRSFFG